MKLSDLVFDRRCSICDKHINVGAVCEECDAELFSFVKPSVRTVLFGGRKSEARYVFEYDIPIVKRLVFSLKHRANKDLFKYAASLYRIAFGDDFCGTVTNCPRGASGIINYGYDQVAEPCKIICKESKKQMKYVRLLRRKYFSKQQKTLNLKQRIENTKDKFRLTKKDIPQNILLVDDVITSGSTAVACAETLAKRRPDVNISFAFLVSRNGFSGKG